LRADPGAAGLVSGVGMHMTKHVFGVYAAAPGPVAPPDGGEAQRLAERSGHARVVAEHDGEATVGAYSVVHGRDGQPEWGLLVCDLAGGTRTYAQVRDSDLCLAAESTELVGTTVQLETRTVSGPAGEQRVNLATW
jgi:acetyl-CoA C-acetyltransferase